MPESKEREKPGAPAQSAIARVVKDPVSRRKFMALTGGSAALGAFLAACGSDSDRTTTTASMGASGGDSGTEQFGKGDVGILNYALTLEYLETAFYADVIKSGLFKGADLATIEKFGEEETEHVAALTAAVKQLGGKPAPGTEDRIPAEERQVGARTGRRPSRTSAPPPTSARRPTSRARRSSQRRSRSTASRAATPPTLNTLLGKSITPDGAFAKPADADEVLKSVEPFIVG